MPTAHVRFGFSPLSKSFARVNHPATVLLFMVSAFLSHVQVFSQWKWLQPVPQGNTIISSAEVAGKVYLLAESSTLLSSSDGGLTWDVRSPVAYPSDRSVFNEAMPPRLSFADAEHGWMVTKSGMYRSTDAGQSWQFKDIPLGFARHSVVYFSGPRHGFSFGEGICTRDGGETWNFMGSYGYDYGFFGAYASIDSVHVWAASRPTGQNGGKVLHSWDGGANWSYQPTFLQSNADTTYSLTTIGMKRSGIGIATGYAITGTPSDTAGFILRSTNAGWRWTKVEHPHAYHTVLGVEDSVWVLIGTSTFSRSTDDGLTWNSVYQPSGTPPPFTAVWVPLHRVIIAAGAQGVIYRSTDLGATWTYIWPEASRLNDVTFTFVPGASTSFGYAVANGNAFLRTTDRGSTWTQSSIDIGIPFNPLVVRGKADMVWVGGDGGVLAKSTDRGSTWHRVQIPLSGTQVGSSQVKDLDICDSAHVLLGTSSDFRPDRLTRLFYTSDAGASWRVLLAPVESRVRTVNLPRPRHFVVGGESTGGRGGVHYSEDAGESWDTTGLPQSVTRLVMFNCQSGLASTFEKLYRTSDGGATWSPSTLNWRPGSSLTSLIVPAEKRNTALAYIESGYPADGDPPGFMVSSNMGATWTRSNLCLPTLGSMKALASIDGIANLAGAIDGGGFVVTTAKTDVLYEPPAECDAKPIGVFGPTTVYLPAGGGDFTLEWTSYDADSAWIEPGVGPVPLSGSVQVHAPYSTEFTITFARASKTRQYTASAVVAFPERFEIGQNYPNPFNASTTFPVELPRAGFLSLKIYNLLGQEVATVFEGQHREGVHRFVWDASGLPSGVYICRLVAGRVSGTQKVLLLR